MTIWTDDPKMYPQTGQFFSSVDAENLSYARSEILAHEHLLSMIHKELTSGQSVSQSYRALSLISDLQQRTTDG